MVKNWLFKKSIVAFIIMSLSLPSLAVASKTWVYWGQLGNHLDCRIETETEPKVGTDTNVTFIFETDDVYNIQIDILQFYIHGAGIYFPSTSVSDTQIIAQGMNVSKSSSFNATYTIKPTQDGQIICWMRAIYSATAFPDVRTNEWVSCLIVIGYARGVTYNELWFLFLIFLVTTIIFLAVGTLYIIIKIKDRHSEAQEQALDAELSTFGFWEATFPLILQREIGMISQKCRVHRV
jgi:hypothetical protein